MKTIVINTSVEAKNTGLDVLFKVPFDPNCLLWFDIGLEEISDFACTIKQNLINETFAVDKDYNLMVLVDLCDFPNCNNKDFVPIYKGLLSRYIGTLLISKLHNKFGIAPLGAVIYFMDAAKKRGGFDITKFHKNAQEQKDLEYKKMLEKDLSGSEEPASDVNTNVSYKEQYEARKAVYGNEEDMIMRIFSWEKGKSPEALEMKMKISTTDDRVLDFSEVYETAYMSYVNSEKVDDSIKPLLDYIMGDIDTKNNNWETATNVKLHDMRGSDCQLSAVSFTIKHDNEQSKLEDYFSVFVSVFTCIHNQDSGEVLSPEFKMYNSTEIADMLGHALKKYKCVLSEKRIGVKTEPIGAMFRRKKSIFKKRSEIPMDAQGEDAFWGKSPEEIADVIMSDRSGAAKHDRAPGLGHLFGLDKKFYLTVEDIFANYDESLIQNQNNRLVKSCLKCLWKWRDKQTAEDFRQTVNLEIEGDEKTQSLTPESIVDDNNVELALHADERENEYSEIINEITETEHNLSANSNILPETENLIIKYTDLMRKCRVYIVSTVGAILSVAAVVLPFIYVQHYSVTETIVHKGLYGCYLAAFAALYMLATAVFMTKMNNKKKELFDELCSLKEDSERDRKESIKALHRFYTATVVKAENHYLFWQEVDRRKCENTKRGNMMNRHKLQLELLVQYVENFMTKLKYSVNVDAEELEEKYRKDLRIAGEETFYSPNNRRVYSFLPEQVPEEPNKEGEEENA